LEASHSRGSNTDNHKPGNKTPHTPKTQEQKQENLLSLTKPAKIWFGMPFTTSDHKTKEPYSYNPAARMGPQTVSDCGRPV